MPENRVHIALFLVIAAVAVAIRIWLFWEIPYGLNQDEASIGYDAFAIGNFGYDRNGFRMPVYPIGFGSGHGPLYTYLSIPAIRLLGLSVFSLRLTNVLLSCTAAIVSYFLIHRLMSNRNAALLGFGLFATAPVLIISARWALDGNPPPSLMIVALYLFVRAIDSQKTLSYALSAAFFALMCYSYGPAAVLILLFLPLSCAYLLYHRKITWAQLAVSAAAFIVVALPVAIFMFREMTDIPASDPDAFITFPRFTVRRTDSVMTADPANFLRGLFFVIFQPQDRIYNMVPGYGATYLFSAPLIIFGLIALFTKLKLKQYTHFFLVFAYFFAGFIMCGTLLQNVNRISVIYPCLLLLITLAIYEIGKRRTYLAAVLCIFTVISFGGFVYDYFGENYKRDFGDTFFYSFGDAMSFAMEKTDDTIYVTDTGQNMAYMLTLFYSGLPPEDYYNTVEYNYDYAEFRAAMHFDRFVFHLPGQKDPDAVYVVVNSETSLFDPEFFGIKQFAFYSVIYPRSFAS